MLLHAIVATCSVQFIISFEFGDPDLLYGMDILEIGELNIYQYHVPDPELRTWTLNPYVYMKQKQTIFL